MSATYYRTVAELDALPDQAVIYDGDNMVWQKGHVGIESGWLAPGTAEVWQASDIALPARLLDDGL